MTYEPGRSFKDRLGLDRGALCRIAIAVVIAVIISAALVGQLAISKGTYNADLTGMATNITAVESYAVANAQDIADLQDDIEATTQQYSGVANTVALHTGSINSTKNRVSTIEGQIATIQDELATVGTPPEAYLTGTTGNYTIHARASETGNYTANVHLVFAVAVVNWTTTVNWTATNAREYIPVETHNGTTIGAWWNIGTFALTAHNTTDITVLFGGLAKTPSFAYVEIYPALRE